MNHVKAATCHGDSLSIMACHLGTDEEPLACAGFVVQVGLDGSPGLRLAARVKLVNPDDYSSGGTELHPTMEAMLAAHPDPLRDETSPPIRRDWTILDDLAEIERKINGPLCHPMGDLDTGDEREDAP